MKKLIITVSVKPQFGIGMECRLDQDEVNEILVANGYTAVEYENAGPCGATDYYRDEWNVTGPDGNRIDARWALNAIFKKQVMGLMTGRDR